MLLLWLKSCSEQTVTTDSSYSMLCMCRTGLLQAYLLEDEDNTCIS